MFGPFRDDQGGAGFWRGFGPFAGPPFGDGRRGRSRWPGGDIWGGMPPFGPFARGARGFGRRAERFLERGDLKYVILDLLKEQPRHGYDIIRALEGRFGGFYSPSPGVVYPTLQLLEDQGSISGESRDGKKIYSITDEGRKLLSERGDTMTGIQDRMRAWGSAHLHPELGDLMHEVQGIGWVLFSPGARGWWSDADKLRRIRAILARTRTDIEAVLRGTPPETTIV